MMFLGKGIYNASFDIYANNYHSVRPGYPALLFDDIKDQCGLGESSRLLEIGAGSGIATVDLAKLGSKIIAIEPGAHLAEIAKQQTSQFKNVEVVEGTFEEFHSKERFDAVLAFTAFHWLEKGNRFTSVLDMLERNGSMVLVWNSFFQSDSVVNDEVNQVYREFLPEVYPDESTVSEVNNGVLSKLNRREEEVVKNPLFYTVFLRKYLTTYNYDEETYPKLLNTFPKVVEVEDDRRERFFAAVSKIVKQQGHISVPVLTTLIVCKGRDFFLESISKG